MPIYTLQEVVVDGKQDFAVCVAAGEGSPDVTCGQDIAQRKTDGRGSGVRSRLPWRWLAPCLVCRISSALSGGCTLCLFDQRFVKLSPLLLMWYSGIANTRLILVLHVKITTSFGSANRQIVVLSTLNL